MAGTATIERRAQFSILSALAAPFTAFGRFLIMVAEANPKMRQLEQLNRVSDEDLAAKGLTRDGEIRRIMGVNSYI
ncbi:hypothetical protein [Paracoccus saliphilus]|uniref:DUF1127 domain-containing protein n=1 Tax=Paracoccus saliphilus TaxID=405559 RepID=A0AA46A5R8_9RHOB|nr:hypothetical protein [Paracoccus saliphilus]WCR04121.1 DUF1127 domain-containing protein [Paracoccus saliphilus]SIS85265.1 hypothetical protein SAMN05421772_106192 [Paracoccus saliphilus]